MKYFKFSIIFFLSSITLNSQNKSGQITFQYKIIENPFENKGKDNLTKKIFDDYYKNLIVYSNKIKYKLVYKNTKSNYKLEGNLALDKDKGYSMANLITGGIEEIYIDSKENIKLKQIDFLGDHFIIQTNKKDEWKLTQEQKEIGDFVCFKAILQNSEKLEVIAWFTPKIPVNFGPKGYGNLPGLILELKIGPIVYYASKIELNLSEMIEINKPTNGKLMTEEDFENMLKKFDKNHR
jgi:GLPGLI family protein